jgi:hypothetical protein
MRGHRGNAATETASVAAARPAPGDGRCRGAAARLEIGARALPLLAAGDHRWWWPGASEMVMAARSGAVLQQARAGAGAGWCVHGTRRWPSSPRAGAGRAGRTHRRSYDWNGLLSAVEHARRSGRAISRPRRCAPSPPENRSALEAAGFEHSARHAAAGPAHRDEGRIGAGGGDSAGHPSRELSEREGSLPCRPLPRPPHLSARLLRHAGSRARRARASRRCGAHQSRRRGRASARCGPRLVWGQPADRRGGRATRRRNRALRRPARRADHPHEQPAACTKGRIYAAHSNYPAEPSAIFRGKSSRRIASATSARTHSASCGQAHLRDAWRLLVGRSGPTTPLGQSAAALRHTLGGRTDASRHRAARTTAVDLFADICAAQSQMSISGASWVAGGLLWCARPTTTRGVCAALPRWQRAPARPHAAIEAEGHACGRKGSDGTCCGDHQPHISGGAAAVRPVGRPREGGGSAVRPRGLACACSRVL